MISTRQHRLAGGAFAGLLVLLALACCEAGQRGLPVQQGIRNFGEVSQHVYRGARPDAAGLKHLQHLGISLIIDLRMPDRISQTEAAKAQANGITYTNVPMRGIGRPTEQQVSKALALIETCPGPVFVHCEHGCDRTGTVIACFRIRHDRWSSLTALQEAKRYGMSKLERGMRRFVFQFEKRLRQAKSAGA
jgi:protein tyrosine/serine phosphatase